MTLRSEDMNMSLNLDFFLTSWFSCNSLRVLYPVPTYHTKSSTKINTHSNYLFIQKKTKRKKCFVSNEHVWLPQPKLNILWCKTLHLMYCKWKIMTILGTKKPFEALYVIDRSDILQSFFWGVSQTMQFTLNWFCDLI